MASSTRTSSDRSRRDEPAQDVVALVDELLRRGIDSVAGGPPSRDQAVAESLRTAIDMATAEAEGEGVRVGLAAYDAWIEGLRNPPEKVNLHANAYGLAILLTSRAAAGEYLRGVADELAGDAGVHLAAAAERYQQISDRLSAARGAMAYPWDRSWTAENREIQARALEAGRDDERAAIDEIERALACRV